MGFKADEGGEMRHDSHNYEECSCDCTEYDHSAWAEEADRAIVAKEARDRRDRFICAALQGMLSITATAAAQGSSHSCEEVAEASVALADATLAAADKEGR